MSRRRVIAVLVSAIVVLAATGGFVLLSKHSLPGPLAAQPPRPAPPPPSPPANTTSPGDGNVTIANNTSKTSTNEANALELNVTIHQAVIELNNSTSITILITNTENAENNVSSANYYPIPLTGAPCFEDRPFGFNIYSGIQNLSSMTDHPSDYAPLQLYYPANYSCGNQTQQPYWMFYPYGQLSYSYGFSGYYSNISGKWTWTSFQPGKYTMVIGDEWGQAVVLYFEVA